MGRPKNLITYAKLNDCDGDLTKRWYVEYAFRLPGYDDPFRKRRYDNLCSGTAEERYRHAEEMIQDINHYLESGEYLNLSPDYDPVRANETYKPEVQKYYKEEERLKLPSIVPEYMSYKYTSLRKSSVDTYKGELQIFQDWCTENLYNPIVAKITRQHMIRFFNYLATEPDNGGRGLCRKTISKYESNLHSLFDYCEDCGYIPERSNPVYRIPKYGKVIDCSSDIYTHNEIERLKHNILPREPYLWLAIELLYYCAIRPGESRELKVKHVKFDLKQIEIPAQISKNKRTASVSAPDSVFDLMRQLGIHMLDGDLYIFGKGGRPGTVPLGKSTLRVRFAEYRRELGISDEKLLYGFKHTAAISAAENGSDIYAISGYMRHSSIATTEKYMHKWRVKVRMEDKKMTAI